MGVDKLVASHNLSRQYGSSRDDTHLLRLRRECLTTLEQGITAKGDENTHRIYANVAIRMALMEYIRFSA